MLFRPSAVAVLPFLLAPTLQAAGKPPVPIPPDLYTKAELSAYRSIATYDEVVAFCERLAKMSPYLRQESFGTSGEGRRLPVVLVSKEKAFEPESRWKSTKPWVLLLGSIHGGEVDGTEAILELLRDVALTNRPEILDRISLVAVPVYNADGYARVSKWNRPNQDGPAEGMGFRTDAQGLDLNRDFVKADAPETRALLALAGRWKPDLFVDNHVTDGADFQATLTVVYGHEPVTAAPLRDWLNSVVPRALADVERWGWRTAPYVEFADPVRPLDGIAPGPFGPRYATGYFGLRGVPSVLVETHAVKPFAERARANARFLAALLELTGKNGAALLAARDAARREARHAAVGSLVTVEAVIDRERPEPIDFATYVWREEISAVSGRPVLRYDESLPTTVPIPLFLHAKATKRAPRPAAYLVPAGWPGIEERLKAHGIRTFSLPKAMTLAVGTYRASHPRFAPRTFQGRTRVTADIERRTETREIPAGSLYVPLDTDLAPLVVWMLEPAGSDSLFSWGEMSAALEQKEWIDLRVLDPLAKEMLAKDPMLRADWERQLKDPAFAGDARARTEYFYRKSPYWDDTVGLLPVYRLEKPLPDITPAGASVGGRE
jgi:hypothetical protein